MRLSDSASGRVTTSSPISPSTHGTAVRDEDLDVPGSTPLLGARKWDDSAAVRWSRASCASAVLGLYANLRPVMVEPSLAEARPSARPHRGRRHGIVRELTGGLYFGERQEPTDGPDGRQAYDTMLYTEPEVRRIVRLA
jgi:3-isopropylmalate dehydrogenase